MKDQEEAEKIKPETKRNIFKRLIQVAGFIVLTAVILFVCAGRIEWIYGWIYVLASVLVIVVNSTIFPTELISERGRKKENVEKWDRLISGLIVIPWFAIYVISGLDVRFGWSLELAPWIHVAGLIIFVSGNALVSWAMMSNIYFSTAVRIQYDRGHIVSSSGPYRYMRHPGYLGMIIYLLATPMVLGSVWAFIPISLVVILFAIRTALEDRTLKEKLEGYSDYAEKVKYRLLPGIW